MNYKGIISISNLSLKASTLALAWLGLVHYTYPQTSLQKSATTVSAGHVNGTTFQTSVHVSEVSGFASGSAFKTYIGFFPNRFNQAPTDISINASALNERESQGTFIGTFSTSDPELNDRHTYTMQPGLEDNDLFLLRGDSLFSNAVFDYEVQDSLYTINITSDDNDGGTFTRTLIIRLIDVNDPPSGIELSDSSVYENLDSASLVGILTTVDQDLPNDSFTYSLVTGDGDTDNGLFVINGDSILTASSAFNFEIQDTYSIRVRTGDSLDAGFERPLTVSILDANDPPTDILIPSDSLSRVENDTLGTVIALLNAVDEDAVDRYAYSLAEGDSSVDNAHFMIQDDQLKIARILNFEEDSVYTFRLQVADSVGETFQKSFSLKVADINDAPDSIYLTNAKITEGRDAGTVVGKLRTIDQDNPNQDDPEFEYILAAGQGDEGNSSFSINSENYLVSTVIFSYNVQSAYSIRVRCTDLDGTGLSREEVIDIAINVEGTNSPPYDITLSANGFLDNLDVGSTIGTFAAMDNDPGDTHTFLLVDDPGFPDRTTFSLDNNALLLDKELDLAENDTLLILVKATDNTGGSFEKEFEIIALPYIDETPPQISTPAYANNIESGQDIDISFTVTDDDELDSVILLYRGILSKDDFVPLQISSSDKENFAGQLNPLSMDDLGMEFYIEALDLAGNFARSSVYRIFREFTDQDGLELPINAISGGKTGDYRLISVPYLLDERSIERLFEIPLGNYDPAKPEVWRLITYSEGQYRDYKTAGFGSSIELGRGYWFNAMEPLNNLRLGSGTVNTSVPHNMILADQWNQIGNPYNVPISWEQVITENPNASIEELWIYNGSWAKGDVIQPFSGGFVWSDGTNPLEIDPKNTFAGSKRSTYEYPIRSADIDAGEWFMPLHLFNGNKSVQVGGLGMHLDARNSKDPFDRMVPPRFGNFVEWYTFHHDFSYPWFRTDIREKTHEDTWEFTMESNYIIGPVRLKWDNEPIKNAYSQLILLDAATGKTVNMKEESELMTNLEKPRSFIIYYNADPFANVIPKDLILGNAYPNPSTGNVTIPLIIPEKLKNRSFTISLINIHGQLVHVLFSGSMVAGFHELNVNVSNFGSGLFMYRMNIDDDDSLPVQKKILIR